MSRGTEEPLEGGLERTYFPLQPMSKSQSVITGKNVVITGGTFNQSVARTELSISRSKLKHCAYLIP